LCSCFLFSLNAFNFEINMMNRKHSSRGFGFAVVCLLTLASSALAAQPAQQPNPTAPSTPDSLKVQTSDSDEAGTLPERIDVQSMKRRYWTVGNEDLMDVVQNRRYTKKGRWEGALKYGFWADDAFQDQKTIGATLGYHLNEFLSLHAFYSSISHANNQAFTAAVSNTGITPRINPGQSVMGAEARGSLVYGKLSLLGSKIFYYDLNVAAGLSQQKDVVGSSIGYFMGLGQQFFLNRTWFVGVDWRLLWHSDKFPGAGAVPDSTRSLTTSWIQIGLGVFFP
jgi:outer membrane beta-barrel protein